MLDWFRKKMTSKQIEVKAEQYASLYERYGFIPKRDKAYFSDNDKCCCVMSMLALDIEPMTCDIALKPGKGAFRVDPYDVVNKQFGKAYMYGLMNGFDGRELPYHNFPNDRKAYDNAYKIGKRVSQLVGLPDV